MSLTAYERETIINFSDDLNETEIYTCSRPIMTKIDKLCKSNPESYKLVKEDEYSKTYILVDKSLISFRSVKKKRNLTEEQKQEISKRLQSGRKESL